MSICTKPYVIIKTQFEGFHYWKDAPDHVAFLRDPHRHMFHVKIRMGVDGLDRDIEIISFKKHINSYIKTTLVETIAKEGWSCEMIADNIARHICAIYDNVDMLEVEVLEDNENGGGVIHVGKTSV